MWFRMAGHSDRQTRSFASEKEKAQGRATCCTFDSGVPLLEKIFRKRRRHPLCFDSPETQRGLSGPDGKCEGLIAHVIPHRQPDQIFTAPHISRFLPSLFLVPIYL